MRGSATNGRKRKEPSLKGGAARLAKTAPGTRAKGKTKADRKVARGDSTPTADAVQRAESYKVIFDEWLRGIDTTTIANKHNLKTARRVQQIVDDLRAANYSGDDASPLMGLRTLERLHDQADYAVGQAAQILAGAMADRNWPSAIGAHRRVAEARRELLELKQLRGILPDTMGDLQNHWDGVELLALILEVFEKHGISDEVGIEIARTVKLGTRRDRGKLELDLRMHSGASGLEIDVDAADAN